MIPFRFWHRVGMAAPILFGAVFARIIFYENHIVRAIGTIAYFILIPLCLYGAYLGLKTIRGPILMRCPFCHESGRFGYTKKEGGYLICDRCGYVHGIGLFKAKLVCEKIKTDEEEA
jgi:hypothetical protein